MKISIILLLLSIISQPISIAQTTQERPLIELHNEFSYLDGELRELKRRQDENIRLRLSVESSSIGNFEVDEKTNSELSKIKKSFNSLIENTDGMLDIKKFEEIQVQFKNLNRVIESEIKKLHGISRLMDAELKTFNTPLANLIGDSLNIEVDSFRNEIFEKIYSLANSIDNIGNSKNSNEAKKSLEILKSLENSLISDAIKKRIKSSIDEFIQKIDFDLENISKQLSEKEPLLSRISKEIETRQQGQTQIDKALLTYALPSFAILIVILLLAPRLYTNVDIQRTILESGLLLELITVFLLTATTLLLGLSGKIGGDNLGTLLGGISGYILGRTRVNLRSKSNQEVKTNKTAS